MESRFVKLFSFGCAFGVCVVALAVMLSWVGERSSFIPIDSLLLPMMFNTALALFLCAASLGASEMRWPRTAAALAIGTASIGSLTMIEHLTGRDLGIDTLFLEPLGTMGVPALTRMSLSTSISLTLCGSALAITAVYPRLQTWLVLMVALMGSIVACAGLVAIVAQTTGINHLSAGGLSTWMGMHTAVCFMLLGLAIILAAKQRTVGRPLWLPIPVFIGLLAATAMIAQAIRGQQSADLAETVRSDTAFAVQEVDEQLGRLYQSLARIGKRWEEQGGTPRALWESDANAHLAGFPFLSSLIWADADGRARWAVSSDHNREPDFRDLRSDPSVASTLNWAIGIRAPRASPVVTGEGAPAAQNFFYVHPLYVNGNNSGFLVALINVPDLFTHLLSQAAFDRLAITVIENGQRLFASSADPAQAQAGQIIERTLPIGNLGRTWVLTGRPGPALKASAYGRVPLAVAITGCCVALLMAFCVHLAVKREEHLRELRASQERLALAVSGTADGLWDWDMESGEFYRSPRFLEMLGYCDRQELPLSGQEFIGRVKPEDRAALRAAIKAHCRDRTPCSAIFRFPHRDGHDVWLSLRGQAVWDAEGKPIRMTGFVTDISAAREADRKIQAYAAELERSNRELDDFAYVASHDLKAPLRVINNASRWLEEDLGPHMSEADQENMALLRGRVQRMEKLLDDLLEYSRVGRSTDARFNEVIGGQALMENILLLLSPPAGFEVRVAPGFADVSVKRMPLQQVLFNLIANAIKHHDRKEGLIEVGVEDTGDRYRFTVRDDGPGIPPRFHEQVFKMFQTLKPRDQVEGSGMGLAMVKKIVDHVGGDLSLESEEGRGASFSFTWPKEPAVAQAAQVEAA